MTSVSLPTSLRETVGNMKAMGCSPLTMLWLCSRTFDDDADGFDYNRSSRHATNTFTFFFTILSILVPPILIIIVIPIQITIPIVIILTLMI